MTNPNLDEGKRQWLAALALEAEIAEWVVDTDLPGQRGPTTTALAETIPVPPSREATPVSSPAVGRAKDEEVPAFPSAAAASSAATKVVSSSSEEDLSVEEIRDHTVTLPRRGEKGKAWLVPFWALHDALAYGKHMFVEFFGERVFASVQEARQEGSARRFWLADAQWLAPSARRARAVEGLSNMTDPLCDSAGVWRPRPSENQCPYAEGGIQHSPGGAATTHMSQEDALNAPMVRRAEAGGPSPFAELYKAAPLAQSSAAKADATGEAALCRQKGRTTVAATTRLRGAQGRCENLAGHVSKGPPGDCSVAKGRSESSDDGTGGSLCRAHSK